MAMIKLDFKNLHSKEGFTLVELLVAIAMFSIVVAGIVSSRISQQNQSITQQQAVDVQQTVRSALSMVVGEIRMAGYNPYGTNYGEGIISAGNGVLTTNGGTGPFTFAYIADDGDGDNINDAALGDNIDNDIDGTVDERGELKFISYFLKDLNGDGFADEFTLNDGPLPLQATYDKLIAENIALLTFSYLDSSNVATAVLNNIRAISISITATTPSNELDRTDGKNNTRNLVTTVKCRNLGL